MKLLLTALTLLILVTVPAYAWEDGTFLCKPLKFDDGSGSDDPVVVKVEGEKLSFDGADINWPLRDMSLMKRPPEFYNPENDEGWH